MNSLALALVENGKIQTTDAKARELRPFVEKMITRGKAGTIAVRRALTAEVGSIAATKIVADISPRYKERSGGYTRITKLPRRPSDGSLMAVIELV